MKDFEPITTLRASIQRALGGDVTDRLDALTCGLMNRHIQIRAYFRSVVTVDDVDQIQCVGSEVIADFPEGYTVEEICLSVEDERPRILDFWAFFREG